MLKERTVTEKFDCKGKMISREVKEVHDNGVYYPYYPPYSPSLPPWYYEGTYYSNNCTTEADTDFDFDSFTSK